MNMKLAEAERMNAANEVFEDATRRRTQVGVSRGSVGVRLWIWSKGGVQKGVQRGSIGRA